MTALTTDNLKLKLALMRTHPSDMRHARQDDAALVKP